MTEYTLLWLELRFFPLGKNAFLIQPQYKGTPHERKSPQITRRYL